METFSVQFYVFFFYLFIIFSLRSLISLYCVHNTHQFSFSRCIQSLLFDPQNNGSQCDNVCLRNSPFFYLFIFYVICNHPYGVLCLLLVLLLLLTQSSPSSLKTFPFFINIYLRVEVYSLWFIEIYKENICGTLETNHIINPMLFPLSFFHSFFVRHSLSFLFYWVHRHTVEMKNSHINTHKANHVWMKWKQQQQFNESLVQIFFFFRTSRKRRRRRTSIYIIHIKWLCVNKTCLHTFSNEIMYVACRIYVFWW